MAKKKNKKAKEKHILGKKEFIFNFVSLVAVICVGLYFGGRSFYYYSLQNSSNKQEVQTLNSTIIDNNKLAKEGDGLYMDSNGYYFKGNITNNYVWIFNRLFRVLRVNNDGTVKLVTEDYVSSFMWGEDSSYKNSNLYNWLTKTDNDYSGIYYDTIPNIKNFLVKTEYTEDTLNKKIKTGKKKYSDYVTTLGVSDYVAAGSSNSFLNNSKIFYLLGLDKEKENLYVEDDGTVQSCDSLDSYGIRAVITLKKDMPISSGDGTSSSPYIIDQQGKTNYIDSYVKLGNDTWKVYNDTNGTLKMYLYGYANINGVEITRNYSNSGNQFDITDKYNIAYYLNTTYLNSLSYNSYLVDNYFYTGEVSDDTTYEYKNIYSNYVVCKVGLLNIFDYVSNNVFNDYFHLNTTSSVGSIQYGRYSNGLTFEADVTDLKHIVPVISINSNYIKSGDGTVNNPYVVE